MPLDERLKASITGFIQNERHSKDIEVRKHLRDEQGKAAARGRLGAGLYGAAQDELCAADLLDRGRRWMATAVRVLSETDEQWTESAGNDVRWLLTQELESDFRHLLDELTGVTAQHGLQGVSGHLATAKDRARASIEQEVALLTLKHDRRRVPLVEQLSAARYALALAAWEKSQSCLAASPPDLDGAVAGAVGAVEALARIVVGDPKPTLGECIKRLRGKGTIDAPLLKGFEEIWGASSETEGVRHFGGGGQKLTPEVAQYLIATAGACLALLMARDVT